MEGTGGDSAGVADRGSRFSILPFNKVKHHTMGELRLRVPGEMWEEREVSSTFKQNASFFVYAVVKSKHLDWL